VLPAWVDRTEPTPEQRDRYWVELAVRALGVCSPAQVADYTYMPRGRALSQVKTLLADGTILSIQVSMAVGMEQIMLLHRQNLLYWSRLPKG
jgi:hypothetical protein